MGRIDFHVHITPPDINAGWRKYAEKEPYFALLSESKNNRFAAAEDAVAALDQSGFDRAVVFGFGFRDMGLCRYVNDYVIDTVRRFPGRLTGFISVPPKSRELEREIDRCCRAGLRGAGELFPAGQDWDIAEAGETAALAAACGERGLPVLVHVSEPVGHHYPGKTAWNPRKIERFIGRHPDLAIILAHWGGGFCFYETMPEVREKCRNVYYDTAATVFLHDSRIYRAAAALGLCEKILFGSDFPLVPPLRYMRDIETSGISAEDRARILGGNAERLLGSPPRTPLP
jgi:predicted TIM-barrel fold metal-dependent hydrolase